MDDPNKQDVTQGMIRISTRVVKLKMRVTPHAWQPATDLFETKSHYIVKVEIAGMKEDDISVSVEDNTVFICGQRPLVNPEGAFHRLEIPYGDFSTTVEIPSEIDQEKVEACYKNGFLTVMLPKAQPVTIEIK